MSTMHGDQCLLVQMIGIGNKLVFTMIFKYLSGLADSKESGFAEERLCCLASYQRAVIKIRKSGFNIFEVKLVLALVFD